MVDIHPILLISCLAGCVLAFNVDTVNPIVFKGTRKSYFGFSVAILENSKGIWLLVGAPRSNDSSLPGVHQPGAVFQCTWQYPGSCKPVFIDNFGNERQIFMKWKNITVQNNKNNQWLGASLHVNFQGDSQVMVCAPRWTDHKFYVQGIQLMNGLCYESNRRLQFHKSSAWPALENWKKQVHASGYFSYGMGSLGTSAAYSRDGTFSVLGAPGLNDWSGGFAYIYGDTASMPRIMELYPDMDSDSYFGMSITTSKLSMSSVSTIIGGPRAGGYGKVYAYSSNFDLLLVKEGSQLGSSFGASICAIDLNGDGLDDLVVGAPLYSDTLDEGRVYVYINKDLFNLELIQPLLAGSNTPGARFGTAVANLGDLNLDSFEDFAVGAPYEDEAGVIYIYNGDLSGLHQHFSQRIVGKSFDKDLKAFGWSFSNPWDVDSNQYKDFAVGSFESDNVVLLRTRPVFDLFANLSASPAVIDLTSEPKCLYNGLPWHCVEAIVCLRYTGLNLPQSAEVNITLHVDTLERHQGERARLFLISEANTEVESINELVTVKLNLDTCFRKYIYIRKSRDVITPLLMELQFDMASNSFDTEIMNTISHIRNKYNPATAVFALHCGDDHVCNPQLEIKATPLFNNGNEFFVTDDVPFFDLKIIVSNTGETSYLTVITTDYPSSVHFASASVTEGNTSIICVPVPNILITSVATINCNIMAPIKLGDKVVLVTRFFAHGSLYDVRSFDMTTKVSTVGQITDTSSGNSTFLLTIPVYVRAEIRLSGVSIPGQLIMPQDLFPTYDDNEWSQISHLYILRNLGPSAMPHGQLTLSVPSVAWIQLINVQVETQGAVDAFSHVPVECSNSANPSDAQLNKTFENESKSQSGDRSVYSATCNSTACSNVTCYIGLMHKRDTVYINISLAVRRNVLQMLKVDDLQLTSAGLLRQPDYMTFNSLTPNFIATTTTYIMYKAVSRQIIAWWMLIISVSCGILLVYFLAVVLWKCGFFRRRYKEELQLLMTSSDTEQELFHSDSHSASSGDIMDLPPCHSFTNHSHHESHDTGQLFIHDMEPDPLPSDQDFDRLKSNQNHNLNRGDLDQTFSHLTSFHSLQYTHPDINNQRNITFHNSEYRNGHQDRSRNTQNAHHSENPQLFDIWVLQPPPSTIPPFFNNDTYLEALK